MLVSLGKIVKAQGLKGAFRVLPPGGESENLLELDSVVIAPPKGPRFTASIVDCYTKGSLYILTVTGVDRIEQVEPLIGGEVMADEADLAPLEESDFYWYEVVGMAVVTEEGRRLGVVESLLATGANDVLQVMDGAKELLLPNIPDVILNIDREKKIITVRLLPGLE